MGKAKDPGASGSLADRIERTQRAQVVATARRKLELGEQLTTREVAALRQWEREQLQTWGAKYLAAMPKGDYATIAGRQPKQLIEAHQRYGFPYFPNEKTVDVGRVLRWFHDFLAANAAALAAAAGEDPVLQLASGKLKDEYVREKITGVQLDNERKRIENAVRVDECVPVEPVRELLFYVADRARRVREKAQRLLSGDDLQTVDRLYEDMIDDIERYVEGRFNVNNFEHYDDQANESDREPDPDALAADATP